MKRIVDWHVGFAYVDPRRPDCMDRLVHAVEDLQLKSQAYRKASTD